MILRIANVDFLTIGQYLQPSPKHYPLQRYYHPDEFKELKEIALSKGFLLVASSPLTRSSYHADEDFKKLKIKRDEQLKCQRFNKKIIPCNKKDLVTMILDIEKYPEFVPWCLSGKIHRKDDKPDMIEMEADLTVGKKFLNQTYTSHVTYYKDKGKILVNNIGGPLKHLENKWQIKEINNQSEVHFEIDFEIKNIVYNMIMQKSFDLGLKKIADAFEERAIKLYTKK